MPVVVVRKKMDCQQISYHAIVQLERASNDELKKSTFERTLQKNSRDYDVVS
jgi:hypothetical protein